MAVRYHDAIIDHDKIVGDVNPNVSSDSPTLDVETSDDTTAGTSDDYGVGATIILSPNDPGDFARIEITFSANDDLSPGDEVIITFEDDWGVAPTMSPNLVTLRSSIVTNDEGLGAFPAGTFADNTVNPDGIRIDFVGPENDEGEVSLQVPDMNDEDGSGTNGIGAKLHSIIPHFPFRIKVCCGK